MDEKYKLYDTILATLYQNIEVNATYLIYRIYFFSLESTQEI